MTKWQPIETAPKDGTVILVAHKHWRKCGIALHGNIDGWLHYACLTKIDHPSYLTHWMPLPEAPTS